MYSKAILVLLLVHYALSCTVINNHLLGRIRENSNQNGEPLYALDGNQVGLEHFTAPDQEHIFSVHSTGTQSMRGVVIKVDSPRVECGVVKPTAENSEELSNCPGGISSTGSPNRRFLFAVKAPRCGCITIRAMVVGMDRHVYGEDGNILSGKLTKTICMAKKEISNSIPIIGSNNIEVIKVPEEPVAIPDTSDVLTNIENSRKILEEAEPNLETVLDEIEQESEVEAEQEQETETTVVTTSTATGPNRAQICHRYDRMTRRHQTRKPLVQGRRVLRRRAKRHGRRGRVHRRGPVVEQKPETINEVRESSNFGWRFRRTLARECCKFEGASFARCYDSVIAERDANLKEPDVIQEEAIKPPVEQEKPIIDDDDNESVESSDESDEEDPDYVPTQEEEESAYDDEEEYEEDELIDSDEVEDLIADNEAAVETEDSDSDSDEDETTNNCERHGRRGRGKCLMKDCCQKGKELGRIHRGRLWKRCVAGSKATIFRNVVTRRQKHKCRVVFRHCCIATGRKAIAEEAVTEAAIKEAELPEVEQVKEISVEEETSSVESTEDSSETSPGRVAIAEQCCAAGARVAPSNNVRCRQLGQQYIQQMKVVAFLRRKCTVKFIRCCQIPVPQQTT